MKLHMPMTLCAALVAASTATAQDASQSKPREAASEAHVIVPSERVLGLKVATATDKNVGEIGDLLLDPKSGEIRYAIVEVGGFLGMGEDDRVVPWGLIEIRRDPGDADKLSARTTLAEKQVESAPKCKKDDVVDASLDERIQSVFGKDDAWAYVGSGPATFVRLSGIKGAKVKGAAGSELGEIQDVALAPQNGCVAYAVLDLNKESGDKDIALPMSRLELADAGDGTLAVSTKLDAGKLTGAPEFDEKQWQRMSSTTWVTDMNKHYGSDPFWKTSRFASARKPKNPETK